METSPFNTEDKPSASLPSWEQFKASIRAAPHFNAADEIQKMHGASDAARTVAHALLAKSAAGYHGLTGGDVDEDTALLGPKSISPEGQYVLHGAMDTMGALGKATGISDLAHSLSSKYEAVQGAAEPLIQKYLGIAPAAAAHAAFEAAPQAAIPGLGEEKALAGATSDAMVALAKHHAENGGFTFHPGTGAIPTEGYAVSLHPGRASVMATPPTPKDLASYLEQNKDAFVKDPAAHIGGWHDKDGSGMHYLDVSHVDPDLGSAMQKARGANQKAIFDLKNFEEIPNPHYNAATDIQNEGMNNPGADIGHTDNPLAPESPLEFTATDPGRMHLNSLPAAIEREGVAAKRTPQAFTPPAITDDSPMPPHNDSYVGNQAFAEGGEVGLLGDALKTVSHLPTPAGLAAKYADNPQAIENFHNWVKNTHVSDEATAEHPYGVPKVVYHNTDAPQDFAAFRAYRGDIGSHFGTQGQANERGGATQWRDPPAASDMTNPLPPKNQQAGQRTIPAYLSIQKPLRTPDLGEWGHENLQNYLLGNGSSGSNEFNSPVSPTGPTRGISPAASAGLDEAKIAASKNNHQLRKILGDAGYDGIVYQNSGEPDVPPAIQLARQDAQQKRDAFIGDPANSGYMSNRANSTADATGPQRQWKDVDAQYNALNGQYQLADEAYRRFYHSPNIQSDSYVAFDPSQVKSAVGNTGEFDPGTQDINHATGGVVGYADGGGVEGAGLIGDAIQQVSHLPLTATAAEAAPLAEHVAQYGGATYSPTSGALHRSGTVTADPASTVALDHAPEPDEIHDFLMQNQHTLEDPQSVLHITSDDKGNHFLRTGSHEPEMPEQEGSTPSDLIDKYLSDSKWGKSTMAAADPAASRPLGEYDTSMNPNPVQRTNWTPGQQTVNHPVRLHTPGIYGPTKDVVNQAAELAAKSPENPMMQRLFGVSRQDLADIGAGRQGNLLGQPPGFTPAGGGSASARNVMTPQNAQRLVDALDYARTKPELSTGMTGWYVMDPAYQRILHLTGNEDDAKRMYDQLNTYQAISSPQTPVDRELSVAGTAHWLKNSGRWNDYERLADAQRHNQEPTDLQDLYTHIYHNSQNVPAMNRYNDRGVIGSVPMQAPKAYSYGEASNVPDIGNQTRTPVGDTHFAGAMGLLDTRTAKDPKGSLDTAELQTLSPWFRTHVSDRAGMEPVPAQANLWGIFAPQTGVKSGIGMPKLELMTKQITDLADKLGVSPETARDYFLMGQRPQ